MREASSFIVAYRPGERDDRRPWGMWETIAVGHLPPEQGGLAFCDKIITVQPGKELSIQKHEFRQEDWEIREGRCTVLLGETPGDLREHPLGPGGRIHIPCGIWHRIRNDGATPLIFAERQTGIYLDEKDILRHPTPQDPRVTDMAAMERIRAEVARLGLVWPRLSGIPRS